MRLVSFATISAALAILAPIHAQAETFKEMLEQVLPGHNRVKAASADVEGAQNLREVARGGWYPTATFTGEYGYEKENKPPGTLDTDMYFKKYEATVRQLLWDFGAANATIDRAEIAEAQAEATRAGAKQSLILDGLTAYINLVRTSQQTTFAKDSESNIRKQTGLEEARVQRGSGLSTDVLQAKTQLAGAEAGRVTAQGALDGARNRFRALFGRDPANVSTLATPPVPADLIPLGLNDAINEARRNNVALKIAQMTADMARKSAEATKASQLYPRVDLVGEARNKINYAGTAGNQTELLGKVQVTYPLNLGFTAINSLRAAESNVAAAEARLADTRDLVEEQVRNAWENLATQKARADYLKNQSNIASEFLELARKERKLGTRSLIDVLAGETALINANSSAASADADVAIAAFTLLSTMGNLDEGAIR
ncbi:outer membrane efflux protein [Paramagnetospirillum kuznetsovii]|uniref:Outer membrane efflux protein n=1 Tax=Paramagnetospirillum kuznetsovii TaxID=2053833 RepID=A0A364P1R6_9PROT|nr:TolC family outer membrane protein [Paramagnetospirillum kuznetsovii]RAU23288.1 outer membrane efflux protein [Paramagnetospirillum kuznetsovii]